MEDTRPVLIETRGLRKAYGAHEVLRGASMIVRKGDI